MSAELARWTDCCTISTIHGTWADQGLWRVGSQRLPPLSAELARGAAAENLVFVTWTDASTLDFALNWVDHLEEWGMPNYLLGALRSCRC